MHSSLPVGKASLAVFLWRVCVMVDVLRHVFCQWTRSISYLGCRGKVTAYSCFYGSCVRGPTLSSLSGVTASPQRAKVLIFA